MTNTNPIEKSIDNAILVEEMAIPLYSQYFESALFWSGLPEEKIDYIKHSMEKLVHDSKEHVILLNKVKNIIKK